MNDADSPLSDFTPSSAFRSTVTVTDGKTGNCCTPPFDSSYRARMKTLGKKMLPPIHDAPCEYGMDCDVPFVTSVATPLANVADWSSG